MKKIITLFSLILLLILLSSCNLKKPAKGFEDEIYVVADSSEYAQLQKSLDSTFQKIIYTPQPEKLFTLKRIDVSRLNHFERMKNIILLAPLNSGSLASKYINAVVDTALKSRIKNEKDFVVYKKDLWARNQLVMVLSAPSIEDLNAKILRNSDNLLYAFQKESNERLFSSLYNAKYEQKKVEGKFLKDYGWTIYVQADFKVAINDPKYNFVWLRRSPNSDMERWIFVHWIDNATPEYLNADSIKAIRNRVTKMFYRTTDDESYVVIAQDYFTTTEVNFNNKYAILTQGLWDLNIKGMGGPFVNYVFYDEATQRFYMLDGSVFAPKYYKRNLIQQMDVTLQSFRTKNELSKDRIKELLDAANN